MTSSGKRVYRWDQERLGAALSVLVFTVVCLSVMPLCCRVSPVGHLLGCTLGTFFLAAPAHVATPSCTPLMRKKEAKNRRCQKLDFH